MSSTAAIVDRVFEEVDRAAEELVTFTSDLIRIPTVNPPGECYEDCAHFIGAVLSRMGFEVEYFAAEGRPEHTARHPRLNVVGTREGLSARPTVHLNGHFDVVPAGEGWTLDPFGGIVRNGRVYGRGACDMKAGIAAAAFAAEAIRRAGIPVPGTIEISGTVDEESGGFAGVAWLAEHGRISSTRTDYCIIPEPLNVDRVCVGHRGVYWFEVAARGHIAHGSMPFLGVSAIDGMSVLMQAIREELLPELAARRTDRPGRARGRPARHAQHQRNLGRAAGGRHSDAVRGGRLPRRLRPALSPRGRLRRHAPRGGAAPGPGAGAHAARPAYALNDLMVVHPTRTPDDSPVIAAVEAGWTG
ncbi:MAG: M20/M25/M40 family metallo-hydrolase [Vicinamibacterales bacterium]